MDVRIEDSWKARLQDEFDKPYFAALTQFVRNEYAAGTVYPPGREMFAALQHITGVNQRQLWHYAAGRSKPRRNQAEKIVASLNKLGKELTTLTV